MYINAFFKTPYKYILTFVYPCIKYSNYNQQYKTKNLSKCQRSYLNNNNGTLTCGLYILILVTSYEFIYHAIEWGMKIIVLLVFYSSIMPHKLVISNYTTQNIMLFGKT